MKTLRVAAPRPFLATCHTSMRGLTLFMVATRLFLAARPFSTREFP